MRRFLLIAVVLLAFVIPASAQVQVLEYHPSPADNPLRGLVPYSGEKRDKFPHSMEFSYLPLNKIAVEVNQFDWEPLEQLLDDVASRGHQTVLRIWIEYPGKNGIPQFLVDDGLLVTKWLNTNTEPFPNKTCWTPDYSDKRLRKLLADFITEFGEKYDGDPRLGFITAGLLGTWGEWHCYPRGELFAKKDVQTEVMESYAAAFKVTPILLRYPAGENSYAHAPNHKLPLGYHDDSFAWATLDTGKAEDNWYFMPAMRSAGAEGKWKRYPIGGEIRPELWGQIFDPKPTHPMAQDFAESVRQTHATWLMDTGMFDKKQPQDRIDRAIRQVQKMGYEFHISTAAVVKQGDKTKVMLTVRNTGVAPFYYDWKLQLGAINRSQVAKTWDTDWKLTDLLPGETRVWQMQLSEAPKEGLAVRVVNPLPGGLPLRFANEEQASSTNGWFILR